jgi:F0F1-type ATP synthase assembly protein I
MSKNRQNKELNKSKKITSNKIVDAIIIGFLFGIIIYSVVNKSWGFLTLIPIYLIYKFVNKSKTNKGNDL